MLAAMPLEKPDSKNKIGSTGVFQRGIFITALSKKPVYAPTQRARINKTRSKSLEALANELSKFTIGRRNASSLNLQISSPKTHSANTKLSGT